MLTRRELLRRGAVLGGAGMAPTLLWRARVARGSALGAPASAPEDRTLIVVQLAGGNDDLNMVVPYGDSAYYSARPTLHVSDESVLRLNDRLGLNPVMGNLKRIWDSGQLAIIEGVGYPDPQYSHFDAMTIWHTAAPKGEFNDGWLGRYFKQTNAQANAAFGGVDIGAAVAPALQANGVMIPTLQNPAAYKMALDPRDAAARLEAWRDLQEADRAGNKYLSLIGDASLRAYESAENLGHAVDTYQPAVTYGRDSLSNSLKLLASIITNQPGTKIAYTTVSGFDTHSYERSMQDGLLTVLSDAFSNFQIDLNAHQKAGDVLLVTWTEFGRRFKENGSQGTDHGDAGVMLAMGGAVSGGLYGEMADLRRLDRNGSAQWTTDFRSVFATLLERWLGVDSAGILGDRFEPIPFIPA
jgi:uncharacterized protein (DUF1501 family)